MVFQNHFLNILELVQNLFLKYWYLYLLFVGLGILAAHTFLKYSTPLYEINSTLLIQKENENTYIPDDAFLKGIVGRGSENLANEIQVISSFSIMDQAVKELNLEVGMAYKRDKKTILAYQEFPILMDSFLLAPSVRESKEYLTGKSIVFKVKPISQEQYSLWEKEYKIGTYHFDEVIQNKFGSFRIIRQPDLEPASGVDLEMGIKNPTAITNSYLKRLKVDLMDIEGTVIKLKLKDEIPSRGIAVLTKVIDIYNSKIISEKDIIAKNSLGFLDDRLKAIKKELSAIERNVESYKKTNKISNETSANLEIVLQDLSKYTESQNELEVQLNIMESLLNSINTPRKYKLIPANLSVTDNEILFKDISNYNQLVLQREQLLRTAGPSNPLVESIDQQLTSNQTALRATIKNLKKDQQRKLANIRNMNSNLSNKLNQVPTQERGLLEIKRQYAVKEELYLFLLQKREETALSIITKTPNSRIIDKPRHELAPVAPIKSLVYLGGLLGGVFFPFLFSVVSNIFRNNYLNLKAVKAISNVPVIGVIPRTRKRNRVVVRKDEQSSIAERFRIARSNLQYPNQHDKQVLSVTSSMEGEGKTFVAINLALCFALTKQKTILVDLNLRNPKVADYLDHQKQYTGITDYVAGDIPLSNIIHQFEQEPQLHYITSGQMSLNPHELLLEKKIGKLFFKLIDLYDIVIVDTPPIGMVADTFLIDQFVTKTVFVVRENKTTKKVMEEADEVLQNEKLSNPVLLVNGTSSSKDAGISSYGFVPSNGKPNPPVPSKSLFHLNTEWKKTI